MNIYIFTTIDNNFLGQLLVKLSKIKKYNFNFIFINENKINLNNLNKILVRIISIGFLNCIYFYIKDIFLFNFKKDIFNKLNKNHKILKLTTYDEKRIKNFIKKDKVDIIISLNFPKKISKKILGISKYGGINLHLGLLPECMGLYPVIRSMIYKINFGITIHRMSNKIDRGQILYKQKLNLKKKDLNNIIKIYSLLFKKSFSPLLKVLLKIHKNKKFKNKINSKNKKYFGKFTFNEFLITISYKLKSLFF